MNIGVPLAIIPLVCLSHSRQISRKVPPRFVPHHPSSTRSRPPLPSHPLLKFSNSLPRLVTSSSLINAVGVITFWVGSTHNNTPPRYCFILYSPSRRKKYFFYPSSLSLSLSKDVCISDNTNVLLSKHLTTYFYCRLSMSLHSFGLY